MAKNKLSIYLIKKDKNINEIFDPEKNVQELRRYSDNKIVYFVQSWVHEPEWMMDFFKFSESSLKQANSKVVLIDKIQIDNEERIFAVVFGGGKSLFANDVLEDQFGLKIVLNTVEKNNMRKIGKISIGSNHKHSQEQMPKATDISEFGFDINRDLITQVTAKSNTDYFGKVNITGGNIFSVSSETDINNIDEFLIKCYRKYKEERYKENFIWIDNIKEIKSSEEKARLDEKLIEEINNRTENVWLSIPEVIEWENVVGFKYNRSDEEIYDDIDLECFLNSVRFELENVKQLSSKKLIVVDVDEGEIDGWPIYKCLIAEIVDGENTYCLNNGKWYRINNSFVEKINNDYDQIPLLEMDFIDYDPTGKGKYTENEYNDELIEFLPNAILMHRVGEIPFGGGPGNKIEVCDILTEDKCLIHVKKNGGSSHLSHLFNQATVSAEALLDIKFRNKVNEKLIEKGWEQIPGDFKSYEYTVVLAIINKNYNERPQIPFFSKVSIQYTVKMLRNMNYNVALKNIRRI